jgi:endo-beta-N-acetylglucosaminidase D
MQRCGGKMSAAYRLSHWRCIDTFVYFSHHLVTVPPAGWVKAAHLHGVKVGTGRLQCIVTEHVFGEHGKMVARLLPGAGDLHH